MKHKKLPAVLLVLLLFVSIWAPPASAEGFTYNFDNGSPHCKSLFMVNVDTGTVVYAMNADEQLPMASLTKIMSYIVAYEYIPNILSTVITVPQSVEDELNGTGSSLADVVVGEELTGLQLLNLMMVPSGNDAALTLAKYVDGLGITMADVKNKNGQGSTVQEEEDMSEVSAENQTADDNRVLSFVDLMNLKARELGCSNTNFTNPHGLHDPAHYTTARDMMTITRYATTLPDFSEIVKTTVYALEPTNKSSEIRYSYTTNRMMLEISEEYYYRRVTGIKTGSLNESGYCIASSAVYNGYTYIIVALGSPYIDANGDHIELHGEMLDSRELFIWAFENLEMKTIAATGDLMGDVDLKYAWKQDKLQVVAGENITAILPKSVEMSSVIAELNIPDSVETPVKKGDVIGTAVLTYADEEVARVQLVAAESVERSEIIMTLEQGKAIFTSKWFLIVMGIIVVLIIIYIILIFVYRKKKKRLKSVKRYRDM